MFPNKSLLVLPVAFASLLVMSSGPALAADGKVSGIIKIQGKPLTAGKIFFHLDNGQFVGSKVKDGKFTVDRVPTGAKKVSVEGDGVPKKFSSEETSPLRVEIKEGDGVYDFVLQ
jgi:hypothetical protein